MSFDFVGERRPLDDFDIPMLAHRLNTGEDELRAFLEVEAASRGYDSKGRPLMLFEPHVFYRLLSDPDERARAVAEGLAYAKWGERPYPSDSYPRLEAAMAINEDAALMSCSIGLSQVLVSNFASVGYDTPQSMWQAFMDDEQEHVEAMVRFILVNGIDDDLRAHRWHTVARVYNGPGYKRNRYAEKMSAAYSKFAGVPDTLWEPDAGDTPPMDGDELKAIQRRLRELGYVEVGRPDGVWGTKTRAGVLAFRADNGLPIYAGVDDQFKAALMTAEHRAVGEDRAHTSADDLRKTGSRTISGADQAKAAAGLLTGGGALAEITKAGDAVNEANEALEGAKETVGLVQQIAESLGPILPWLMIGIGAYVFYTQVIVTRARVDDHRTGKNAGPGR